MTVKELKEELEAFPDHFRITIEYKWKDGTVVRDTVNNVYAAGHDEVRIEPI